MTKTQANEPGFVDKLEADSLDAIVEVIGAPRLYNDGKSAMRKWFLNRLRSARLVPSPAYGGVKNRDIKELWLAHGGSQHGPRVETYTIPENAFWEFIQSLRACLSPVAVEEADAKADTIAVPRKIMQAIAEGYNTRGREDRFVIVTNPGFLEDNGEDPDLVFDLSIPPPQIGKAGAGPVGEAVAWREFVLSRIKALGEGDQYGLKSFAIAELQSLLDHAARPVEEPGEVGKAVAWQFEEFHVGFGGRKSWHWRYSETHPGQRPDIRNVRPLYARPVDEPGEVERDPLCCCGEVESRHTIESDHSFVDAHEHEVERLTRALDAARKNFAFWEERENVGLKRALAAEAALAETRERLEKVADGNRPLPYGRDELGRFVRDAWIRWAQTQPNPKPSWLLAYDELPEPDKEADRQIGEAIARWTLIGDAARAALTGDAQEAGR